VRRCSDIWVTGCSYVESVTFVRKYDNIFLILDFRRVLNIVNFL